MSIFDSLSQANWGDEADSEEMTEYRFDDKIYNGVIHKWFHAKNHGFVLSEDGESIYCHQNAIPNDEPVKKRTKVQYSLCYYGDKRRAIKIKIDSLAPPKSLPPKTPTSSGIIHKWFHAKNHGFILTEDGDSIYCHQNAILNCEEPMKKRTKVTYALRFNDGKRYACNVQITV